MKISQGLVNEEHNHVLSLQADIISVLSGHSHSRSGRKQAADLRIKFQNNKAPMS